MEIVYIVPKTTMLLGCKTLCERPTSRRCLQSTLFSLSKLQETQHFGPTKTVSSEINKSCSVQSSCSIEWMDQMAINKYKKDFMLLIKRWLTEGAGEIDGACVVENS